MLQQFIENGIVVNRTTTAPHKMTDAEKLQYLQLRQETFQRQIRETTGFEVDVDIRFHDAPDELIETARALGASVKAYYNAKETWNCAELNARVRLFSVSRDIEMSPF